mgnify:CR=1 FL=1
MRWGSPSSTADWPSTAGSPAKRHHPQAVADHDGLPAAGEHFFLEERASLGRPDAEHLEEALVHHLAEERHGAAAAGEVARDGRVDRRHPRARARRSRRRSRPTRPSARCPPRRSTPRGRAAARAAGTERAQRRGVDYREERGVRPDAERQRRECDRQLKAGRAEQPACTAWRSSSVSPSSRADANSSRLASRSATAVAETPERARRRASSSSRPARRWLSGQAVEVEAQLLDPGPRRGARLSPQPAQPQSAASAGSRRVHHARAWPGRGGPSRAARPPGAGALRVSV